ncbi:unnamed protein product [Bursaphelenchus okinawaensis]|uniref:Uncharacterized protein n=1 Tax=Bursaphelenchus okinawaensis TaxID=465554 RepID=A0A811KRR7_9BILA|nr:unnamed protein product [Bursaphelenchus okinawaensis]CAG9110077.1 unnamed protein product [Bursaphelenchus okinawaensis]
MEYLEKLELNSADEFANTAILEMADPKQHDIRSDQVDIQALKALWQFFFIHRSEALRNLTLVHVETMKNLIESSKYLSASAASRLVLFKFVKFVFNTSDINVKLQEFEAKRENYGEKSSLKKMKERNQDVEELERLRAQTEFLLNQLYNIKSLPKDRRFLMKVLCEMADIIGKEIDENSTDNKMKVSFKEELEAGEQDEPENFHVQDENSEFQVFEGDGEEHKDAKEGFRVDEFEDINAPMKVLGLKDELKVALSKRKADFDQRQFEALAKLKNCTVDEVVKQEEERKQKEKEEVMKLEKVEYAPQQRIHISTADLLKAMKKQPQIVEIGND